MRPYGELYRRVPVRVQKLIYNLSGLCYNESLSHTKAAILQLQITKMNQIISICGSQGCGKSTTIRELHNKHNYTTDSFSTPRYVQSVLGYSSLAEVLAQPIEKIKDYQLKILDTKFERDMKNKTMSEGEGAVIVERNFLDIYAFAKQWALDSNDNDFLLWVDTEYKDLCKRAYKEIDYFTILLTPLKSFEVDPRRASEDTRFAIHERMFDALFQIFDRADERGGTGINSNDVGHSTVLGFEKLSDRITHIHEDIQLRYFPEGVEAKKILNSAFAEMFGWKKTDA